LKLFPHCLPNSEQLFVRSLFGAAPLLSAEKKHQGLEPA